MGSNPIRDAEWHLGFPQVNWKSCMVRPLVVVQARGVMIALLFVISWVTPHDELFDGISFVLQ